MKSKHKKNKENDFHLIVQYLEKYSSTSSITGAWNKETLLLSSVQEGAVKYTKPQPPGEDASTWQCARHEWAYRIGYLNTRSPLWKFSTWRFICGEFTGLFLFFFNYCHLSFIFESVVVVAKSPTIFVDLLVFPSSYINFWFICFQALLFSAYMFIIFISLNGLTILSKYNILFLL